MKRVSKVNKVLASTVALSAMAVTVSAGTANAAVDTQPQDAIKKLQEAGVLSGDASGIRPNDSLQRQELAVILAKTLKLPIVPVTKSSFKDIPANSWAAPYVEAVHKAGIMNGDGNGSFRPSDAVTREETAIVFVRSAGEKPGGVELQVQDKNSISDWAKDYVAAAVKLGLMKVEGNTFNPTIATTRGEAAVVTVTNMEIIEKKHTSNSDPVVSFAN